jgi:hypothetical protein
MPDVVERAELAVLARRVPDELPAIQRTWAEVEAAVGLRGRHFYGAFDPATEEYLVCVVRADGDDADALGLVAETLPGGRFARTRLHGEPPAVYERIGPAFRELHERYDVDHSRLQLEHYRRHDEIDILVPIR